MIRESVEIDECRLCGEISETSNNPRANDVVNFESMNEAIEAYQSSMNEAILTLNELAKDFPAIFVVESYEEVASDLIDEALAEIDYAARVRAAWVKSRAEKAKGGDK